MDDPGNLLLFINFILQGEGNIFFDPTVAPSGLIIQFIVIVLGLLFSALFSGSEAAFSSLANQIDLLSESDIDGTVDQLIMQMLEHPRQLFAAILIGNILINTITAVFAAVITGNLAAYIGFSVIPVYIIGIVILLFMILVLSNFIPRMIAVKNPLRLARRIARFIYLFFKILSPFSSLIANSTLSLKGHSPQQNSNMTTEDLMTMAELNEQEGAIKSDEREIIENVIKFGSTTVREIMTSRVNIVAISTNDLLDEVLDLIRDKGLSRMPIYEDNLDNIIGVIHSKDALPYINSSIKQTTINWRTIARKALFIPATKKLDDLLRDFQQEKTHIALVVDEYGGTEGLITLDDILEEIVGDISDEYKAEEQLYTKFESGVYIFDAKIDLNEMENILDCELTTDEDDFETLGGLIYHLTERLPNVGECIYYNRLELTIHSVQNNRVGKLRVKIQDHPKSKKEHHHTKK